MNSQTRSNHVHRDALLVRDEYPSSSCLNEENNCLDATLKFITNMLMEEDDLENTPYMLDDSLALLATQKSLHAILNKGLGHQYPECLEDHTQRTGIERAGRDNTYLNQLDGNEEESSEMYDDVLLSSGTDKLHKIYNEHSKGGRVKTKGGDNTVVVDLRSLLMTCAQAVSSLDTKTATHLLLQIRMHSSPQGDSLQRVAHCLANALEARLNGNGTASYVALNCKRRSASEVLRARRMCITACPFTNMSILLANEAIEKLAIGATTLHIIDFGILYGFQWPSLIQILSKRHGGPPKLRITGIEFPQKVHSHAEGHGETGRRLSNYCNRFGVPFEYNAITQNWETIRVEDLQIKKDELVVVNCMFRLHHLLDETVTVNNPRDAVLNLIKNSNPAMFIHGIFNTQCNVPFFTTRFSEAMFFFSNIFDVLEATIPREDEDRQNFEELILGRTAMNVIACEGTERGERPETNKYWQTRMLKAGFQQLPLDRKIVRYVRSAVKNEYHKDFYVDEDGKWFVLGWKGRVIEAISFWQPAHN